MPGVRLAAPASLGDASHTFSHLASHRPPLADAHLVAPRTASISRPARRRPSHSPAFFTLISLRRACTPALRFTMGGDLHINWGHAWLSALSPASKTLIETSSSLAESSSPMAHGPSLRVCWSCVLVLGLFVLCCSQTHSTAAIGRGGDLAWHLALRPALWADSLALISCVNEGALTGCIRIQARNAAFPTAAKGGVLSIQQQSPFENPPESLRSPDSP